VSRRRRRKGKSQIWDSKIWSRVPRDSDPRKTTLARASSIYKRQTRSLVREGAPQRQDRNCQRVINIWSWAPDGLDTKTYWLTDRQSQCDFDSELVLPRISYKIVPSTVRSSSVSFLSYLNHVYTSTIGVTCPAYLILLDFIIVTIFSEKLRLVYFLYSSVISSLFESKYSPQHPVLKLPQSVLFP
jgi:hypothetical protein